MLLAGRAPSRTRDLDARCEVASPLRATTPERRWLDASDPSNRITGDRSTALLPAAAANVPGSVATRALAQEELFFCGLHV
jgi:hypothetical protein